MHCAVLPLKKIHETGGDEENLFASDNTHILHFRQQLIEHGLSS